jgi:hypothetical protein
MANSMSHDGGDGHRAAATRLSAVPTVTRSIGARRMQPGQPAASLRAQSRRLAHWRREQAGPWWMDTNRRTVLTAPICSPALVAWALISEDPLAWVAFALHTVLVATRAVRLHSLRTRDTVKGELDRAVRAELATADALEGLPQREWVILHDRLLPGTGLRFAHLAVGSAGVVLVGTASPPSPTTSPLGWAETRDDERMTSLRRGADRIASALASEVGHSPAPVIALAVECGAQPPSGKPVTDGVCPLASLACRMADLPGTLSPSAVGFLGRLLDEICPPAEL